VGRTMSWMVVALSIETSGAAAAVAPRDWTIAQLAAAEQSFDFPTQGPLEMLEVQSLIPQKLPSMKGTMMGIVAKHPNWVREEHLPALVALVDSQEPCAHLVTGLATTLPDQRSFVGQEALVLIQAYRDGVYPPKGLGNSEGFSKNKAAILKWYRSRPAAKTR
jgi:hypothetical protein